MTASTVRTLPPRVYLAVALAAVNLAIGGLVSALKLPIYLDSIGIVVGTLLLGAGYGTLTALITVAIGGLVINPFLPFYVITSLGIVASVEFLYRFGGFNTLPRSALSGLAVAVVSAVLSAPVTTYLGGNTMSGVDALTAFFLASGKSLLDSVLVTGLTSEPVDKTLVCVLAYLTVTRLPRRLIASARLRTLPR